MAAPGFEPVAPDANAERGEEGEQRDRACSCDGRDDGRREAGGQASSRGQSYAT